MDNRVIQIDATIIEALKQMDIQKVKVLIVMNNEKFQGLITIGDIQRAIIKNIDIESEISVILDKNKQYATLLDSESDIKNKMMIMRAEIMPLIDVDGNLLKIYNWEDFFVKSEINNIYEELKIPVVIMAGGKGERLRPLTNIYPKPLIPIGDKTIIETIMDKFVSYKCNDFYISVNYKADVIKNYFSFIDNKLYNIKYFQESKPMGTAGSLRLLKDNLKSTFFVSNCDIIVNNDFSEILRYHRENNNDLTVVAAMKTFSIPYGTIKTGSNGIFESIIEKPTLSYKINTGLYVLEPSVLNLIPDTFFHITNLMEKLNKEGYKVGVYPISQNDWKDMGEWDEYIKLVRSNNI